MLSKIKLFLIVQLIVFSVWSQRQDSVYNDGLIQFSGVLVSNDSVTPVPYAHIIDITSARGTTSDYYGYYSFVARKGDSIRFSSVGFKTSYYHIPNSLTEDRYSLIYILEPDTVMLAEAKVYPWPSREQFADAFVNLDLPNDDLARARKNLDPRLLAFYAQEMPMDAAANFDFQMSQVRDRLYFAGQLPPNNLLNLVAWGKFIKAWKRGDFKKKEPYKYEY